MQSRSIIAAVGVSAAALAVSASFAPLASAQSTHSVLAFSHPTTTVHPAAAGVCYDQTGPATAAALQSTNFQKSQNANDDRAGDNFTLKAACTVKTVTVAGAYNSTGPGPARSENVTFYANAKGLPGKVIANVRNVKGTDDGTGNFVISLGAEAPKLAKGQYWLSVQANMNSSKGAWGWTITSEKFGASGVFENPGGGIGIGCTTWTPLQTCVDGLAPGQDFIFTLASK
jgi:hypothetical protein